MTEISKDEQVCRDFDWFCLDEAGHIGHFASAGFKLLPNSVGRSAEDLEIVTRYFEKELTEEGDYVLDENLVEQVPDFESIYLKSFIEIAAKGLFSYDIASHLSPGISYFRVALPRKPLRVEQLPNQIREIVERTVLKGILLRGSSRIAYQDTLGM